MKTAPGADPRGDINRENELMQDEGKPAETDAGQGGAGDAKKGGGAKAAPGMRLKVSEKGALSVYGLGRFPVTLYKEQWKRLLGMSDEIKAFIAQNDAQLKTKGADASARAAATPAKPPPMTTTRGRSGAVVLLAMGAGMSVLTCTV